MTLAIRTLLIEDNDDHAALVDHIAGRAGILLNARARTLAEARTALRDDGYDLVLLDLNLPDSRDLATLESVLDANGEVPVVVLTSLEDRDRAMEALNTGAEDYLGKSEISADRLERTARYAIERHHMVQRLRHQSNEVDRFTASIARDLRTPTHTMRLVLDWLREDYGPFAGVGAEYVRMLEEASHQVSALLEDLVAYANAARGSLHQAPTALTEVMHDAVQKLSDRGLLVPSDVDLCTLPVAMVDRTQIEAVFCHLLEVAAACPGDFHPRICVRTGVNGPLFVEVIVEHAGTAFAFSDPDHTLDHDTTRALALANRIVEAHGGYLSTRREPDGSSVSITLARLPSEVLRTVGSVEGAEN